MLRLLECAGSRNLELRPLGKLGLTWAVGLAVGAGRGSWARPREIRRLGASQVLTLRISFLSPSQPQSASLSISLTFPYFLLPFFPIPCPRAFFPSPTRTHSSSWARAMKGAGTLPAGRCAQWVSRASRRSVDRAAPAPRGCRVPPAGVPRGRPRGRQYSCVTSPAFTGLLPPEPLAPFFGRAGAARLDRAALRGARDDARGIRADARGPGGAGVPASPPRGRRAATRTATASATARCGWDGGDSPLSG